MMKEDMTGKSLHNFDFIKKIGEGAWAQVYLAYNTKDSSQVAIKAVSKKKIKQVPKLQQLVKTQIKVLRECQSDNVIRFVDNFTSDKTIFIATQFCNGGDMEQYLRQKKTLTEDQATMFLKHILNGFTGLHKVNAMHRDFKLANILLHNGVAKIADLGFAKQMVNKMTGTILGTSLTMAPQVLDQKHYDNKADIWSLAVVYYQMIYGKYPYNGNSDLQILTKIKKNRPDYKGVRISDNCKDFIDRCLQPDPVQRISWAQIYDHPLIRQNQKNINFVYGNQKGNISQNRNFYEKIGQTNKQFIYPQLNEKYNIDDVKFSEVDEGDIRETVNWQAKKKMAEKKKEMQDKFQVYSKQYFMKRNDIMFLFKFIAPYIFGLSQIKANHGIYMFIMSKKALLDMQNFFNYVQNKGNYFKIVEYWEQFLASQKYKDIENLIRNDLDIIYSQCLSYSFQIHICSKQIQAEKNDISTASSKKFGELLNNMVGEYWFLLADGLDFLKDNKKDNLLKVLQALDYYKGQEKINIEQFDMRMLHTDMDQMQRNIRQELKKIYS